MRTTIQKYNNLCDMNIIDRAKYSINDRVAIIIQEVNDYLDECERRARTMLGYDEKTDKQDETKLVSYMKEDKL